VQFALHPQLAKECAFVCDLKFCRLLLMNNRHFPWLVLVPMEDGKRELFDLAPGDYAGVLQEVRNVAQVFSALTGAHKMNIAALGNQVPQLHIHVIARHLQDAAWPNPVWNSGITPTPYDAEALGALVKRLQHVLAV
jgi:diadenosine tetraphosphate (Ap4A) HIT family hydrolase